MRHGTSSTPGWKRRSFSPAKKTNHANRAAHPSRRPGQTKGRPRGDGLSIVSHLQRRAMRGRSPRERSDSHNAPQATLNNETLDHLLSVVDTGAKDGEFLPRSSMVISHMQQMPHSETLASPAADCEAERACRRRADANRCRSDLYCRHPSVGDYSLYYIISERAAYRQLHRPGPRCHQYVLHIRHSARLLRSWRSLRGSASRSARRICAPNWG